jgi:hypothetical protein
MWDGRGNVEVAPQLPFDARPVDDGAMAKANDVRESEVRGEEERSRRKRERASEPTHAFARAFADALRDILYDERRRAA